MAQQDSSPYAAAMLGPDLLAKQYQLQQAQAYAQMLMKSADDQRNGPAGEMISGHYVPTFNGLKSLGTALLQRNAQDGVMDQTLDYNKALSSHMADILRGSSAQTQSQGVVPGDAYQPAMDAGATVAPQQQATSQPGLTDMATLLRGDMVGKIGGPGASAAFFDQFKTSPDAIRARELGIGLDTQKANYTSKAEKEGYIPPTRLGEGYYNDPKMGVQSLPDPKSGFATVRDSTSPTGWKTVEQPGGIDAVINNATAAATGASTFKPGPTQYGPHGPFPTQSEREIFAPQSLKGQISPQTAGGNVGLDIASAQREVAATKADLLKVNDQSSRAQLQAHIDDVEKQIANAGNYPASAAGIQRGTPVPQLGAEATANAAGAGSAKDAVENYNSMHQFATTSAPRNIGLLTQMSQLFDKTMTGPGADKAQFVNGVLNTLGIPVSADAAQNYQMLKKNSAMLVGSQRMGAGSGGTDALQSMLEAANPDAKTMNPAAGKEAAQELIAYNRMMMAMDSQAPNPSTNPQAFTQFQTKTAAYADPRLWQIEHAENDKDRIRILSLMPESERQSFFQKAKEARQMGLLK